MTEPWPWMTKVILPSKVEDGDGGCVYDRERTRNDIRAVLSGLRKLGSSEGQ